MRTLKKTLALVLCLAMIAGLCCFGTSAAFADAADIEYTEAVDVMNALGVLKGDGTNFNPKGVLTRAEAAVMLAKMLGAGDMKATSTFKDMKGYEWAQNYAAFCENAGLILGDGKGNFLPGQTLTGYQFGLMLSRALGYKPAEEGVQSATYEIGTAALMKKNGLATAIPGFDGTKGITREQAAALLLKTLQTSMVEYKTAGTTITVGGTTIVTGGAESTKIKKENGTVSYTGGTHSGGTGTQEFCEEYFPKLFVATSDDVAGRTANYWYYGVRGVAKDLIGVYAAPAAATYVVGALDATKTLGKVMEEAGVVLASDDTDLDTVVINKSSDTNVALSATPFSVGDVVNFYVNPITGYATKAVVLQYEVAKITGVDTNVSEADAKTGVTAYVFLDGIQYKNTAIPGFDAATYVKNTYLAVAKNGAAILDSYVAGTVEGKLADYTATGYTFDGKSYTFNDSYAGGLTNFENTYKLLLDANGFVIGDDTVVTVYTLSDVYYVTGVWQQSGDGAYGSDANKYYAQLVNLEGEISQIEVGSTVYSTASGAGTRVGPAGTTAYSMSGLYTYKYNPVTKVNDLTEYTPNGITLFKDEAVSAQAFTAIDTKIGSYYYNANTKFIVIGQDNSKTINFVTTSTATAALSLAKDSGNRDITVIYSKETGTNVAQYVIVRVAAVASTKAVDLLYCASTIDVATSEFGKTTTLYKMDGTPVRVVVSTAKDAVAGEFYEYTVATNTKGVDVYTLSDYDATLSAAWNKTIGIAEDEYYTSQFNGKLTSTGHYVDIPASAAVVVDLRSPVAKALDTQYAGTIASLEGIATAELAGYNVKFDGYFTADGYKVIFVTDAARAAVTFTLTDITCNKGVNAYAPVADAYTFTLTAAEGKVLPNTITVKNGDTTLTVSTDYSYNKTTGVVTILAGEITAATVTVIAAATTPSP